MTGRLDGRIDGLRLVTACSDGSARLWSATDGRMVTVMRRHAGPVVGIVFAPDGKRIVTIGEDRTARLWSEQGVHIAGLTAHTGAILGAVFSGDNATVATHSEDRSAILWGAQSGKEIAVLSGHTDAVLDLSFSVDSRRLVTASADTTARVWHSHGDLVVELIGAEKSAAATVLGFAETATGLGHCVADRMGAACYLHSTRRRADGNYVYGAYGDSFATADGRHVMVVAITDRQWAALLRATGLQESLPKAAEALGHRLDSEDARYAARELISTALRPWFAARTLAAIGAAFTDRALLWGPYRDFVQMLAEDPRVSEANPMFRRTLHPGVGEVLTATTPLAFGGAAPLPPGIAPRLGEHTHAVLQQRLGLDDAALQALVRAGAIAGR